MKIQLLILFVGLAASNFIYQMFTAKDYETAIERSFFQFVALALAWIICISPTME